MVPLRPISQGDFKNISMILQNKSLITGNYGLPVSEQSLLTPHPPSSFLPSALSSPLLYKRPTGSGEERLLPERGASDITDTDVLLPFIWSGSLSTAITGREIKTGPSGGIASPPADGCVRVNGLANGTWALSALAE